MFSFYACGPSAEEKAAMEKARQDSISAVEQARQDSIKAAEEASAAMEKARQDSIAAVDKARQDSIAEAEEASKKKGSKPAKTKEQKQVEETKKVTGGKG
jgi:hypothetical protein